MRSGFVALVGRPNVGKSTLLNAMVGKHVAIATPVPQTTRHTVRGVLHGDDVQVVFVDTPGLHRPRTLLGSRLNDMARDTLTDVDLLVWLVDGQAGIGTGDRFVAGLLDQVPTPTFAVLNKVDRMTPAAQLPALAELAGLGDFAEVVPVSARDGDQVDVLTELVVARMPEGPPYYPPQQVTDAGVDQQVSERIREAAITRMREEVPHSIAVVIDEVTPGERDDVQVVHATIYVERDSQKGIVIGKRGAVLREIGTQARPQVAALLGTRVHLDLRVGLMREWQRDPKALQRLGW